MKNKINKRGKSSLKLIISLSLIILISLINTSAQEIIKIYIPESFYEGDAISFDYEIFSENKAEITLEAGVDCPLISNTPEFSKLSLIGRITESYGYGLIITSDMEGQTCKAYVRILSPIPKIFEKEFEIVADQSFSFKIQLNKKIFILNEDISLDYNSDVENPSITSILTYPDKTSEQITLPTTIKAEQIGTYELEATASKEGYKTVTTEEQFGVIEKHVEIKSISISGIEDTNEFEEKDNIAEDSKQPENPISQERSKIGFGFIVFVIFLVSCITVVLYFLLKKRH